MLRRRIPHTDLWISPVSLGCWPMSGISSLGVTDATSEATVEAALEVGVNHFDTAYSYGYDGRSDRILKRVLGNRWDQVVLSSKVGSHYGPDKQRVLDSTPARLVAQTDEIRERLGVDCIDLLYLHAPDGRIPIEKAAETFAELQTKGKIRFGCLSNATAEETIRFARILAPALLQPIFNMLQQDVLGDLASTIDRLDCGVASYWPLMKGLLAGKLRRDHRFEEGDRRVTYPMYQDAEWEKNQAFLDRLDEIANSLDWSLPRLVVHWTMKQNRITTVLCGAKRPEQIRETAEAMTGELGLAQLQWIEDAIRDRLAC